MTGERRFRRRLTAQATEGSEAEAAARVAGPGDMEVDCDGDMVHTTLSDVGTRGDARPESMRTEKVLRGGQPVDTESPPEGEQLPFS